MSRTLLNYFEENGQEQQEEDQALAMEAIESGSLSESESICERLQSMSLHKRETTKRGEELSWDKYGLWRQEQKNIVARLEKQLKMTWELEELIEEQLNRYHSHYNHAMVPTTVKDISNLLMPKWLPPHELAALSWLGDWRPSAILHLVHGLAQSSLLLSDSTEQLLSQLVHEIHIEETIIDEEVAELQATCILYLPFSPLKNNRLGPAAAMSCIEDEFKKIERVIIKAQQLRFKALELVVKKVLSHTDAAEFLVAFSVIQDAIHQFAEQQRLRKGSPTVPVKSLGSS